jgi:hypothetical protein
MDVLAPITMKNAARMRYAMWIAEHESLDFRTHMALALPVYLFQCAQPNIKLNVRENSLIKFMLQVAVIFIYELLGCNTFFAPEIK